MIPDLDFMFHMFFLARYCKLLEENSFRGRTADFFYMLLFGATVLTSIVIVGGNIPYLSESFAKIIFLSNSLTFMMVSYFLLVCIQISFVVTPF
jgi:Derlin-2/3